MPILYDEKRRRWALQGANVTYGLELDTENRLRHVYFGGALPRIEDLPDVKGYYFPFESPHGPGLRYEFPAWGSLYYREPCLRATFADGVRDTRLVYHDHRIANDGVPELVVVLRDAHYPLRVGLHYRLFEEQDLVERFAVLENEGEEPVTLEEVLSATWHVPRGYDYRLTHLAGQFAGETQVYREGISPGKKVFESRRGHTSHHANPFFALDRGNAIEDSGEVWFGALGWSGNWKIAVDHDAHGFLQVSGGINDFDFSWHLAAGEELQTPSFIGGYTREGFGGMSRNLHRYTLDHLLPTKGPLPVLYNSWEATYFDVNEKGQGELAEKAASLGVELFVVDDGWFGERHDDGRGLGDWWVNPEKFPNGLHPLIEKVHALGMEFGLWVEPEMVNKDSDLYREHPDWVYRFPNRELTESRNQLVLNLAKVEVREHLFGVLDGLLAEHDISFVKWDMNRPFSEPGWPEAPLEKQREAWVRHVWGIYEILHRLRRRHPGVYFETCAGGGGRVDLGMFRYADQAWVSDNTDPYDRLRIQEGFSMAYPARVMMCWVADSGKWVKGRETSVAYRFHSAMMGSLGVGGNLIEWSTEEMEEARGLVEKYKEIRDVVQGGDQYRLLSPREGDTTAVQYVSRDSSRSILFVFRSTHQFPDPAPTIFLRGLNPEALYLTTLEEEPVSGKALMWRGVKVRLDDELSSVLVEIVQQ
ncbi:MAG: alpha-galactosidase [Rubrobacteraceae bacterium]